MFGKIADSVKSAIADPDTKGGRPSTTTTTQSGGKRRTKTAKKSKAKKSKGKKSKGKKSKTMKKKSKKCKKCAPRPCHCRRRRGGGVLATAALPFGILGLQKFFQTRRGRKDLKSASKTIRKTSKRAIKSVKKIYK
jgi:hypothetical protein